ncbi:MAG: right-handed parallel beta-helix repeat-containing protein [Flavobacteriales bacterium]|nr:right-handed parallel beta-helix repeat-containing protein [Flavobacteriales bacterium]MCB9448104.1 right-handed parallel beta-helix repeat-containing protein [Flavobacteriales bacterium]
MPNRIFFIIGIILIPLFVSASTYHVGPGQTYSAISDVPLENLNAGDSVLIHYRSAPYREKFVIGAHGTAASPVVIMGVDSAGILPVIDGDGAVTRQQLDFWSENRGIIKVGGTSTPSDDAAYVEIRNLDIRTGKEGIPFTDDGGNASTFAGNAAAIFVEKGDHITISHCDVHDCGNGIFVAWQSSNILIEYCHIYDNGKENSIYEHNTYTEAQGIVYQFNVFGKLRANCLGNNLKDRSAGTVIRYNWIEGGNRQLDLVESDYSELIDMPEYRETFVYNNVLVEFDNDGNSQILHYGGDNGDASLYRKGTLHFYYNTVVSFRSGNTTLMRLSTNDESADIRNNVIYATAGGTKLALVDSDGKADLRNNWLNSNWRVSHSNSSANVNDISGNLTGADPVFTDLNNHVFQPDTNSPLIGKAGALNNSMSTMSPLYAFDTNIPTLANRNGDLDDIGAWMYTPPVGLDPVVMKSCIRVFPNPSSGTVFVRLGAMDHPVSAILSDILGKTVWTGMLEPEQTSSISIPGNGTYLLLSPDLPGSYKKIVVE